MGRDRNDQGRYADGIAPEAVLEVFDAREDHARPLTANDITEDMGIARRTAHNKLNALVERGELETRKVGARGRVWWIPDPAAERDAESGREPAVTPSEDPRAAPRGHEPSETQDRNVTGHDHIFAARKRVHELDLPGGDKVQQRREKALLALYARLLENKGEVVETQTLKEEIDPDEVGYASVESFWSNCLKSSGDRPNALASLPGVEELGNGRYRYTEPEV